MVRILLSGSYRGRCIGNHNPSSTDRRRGPRRKVVAVSDGKITVFDKRDSENDTFVVTADTKISRNGKPAKLSDIQAGDMAKVVATSQGEKLIAKQILAVAPE